MKKIYLLVSGLVFMCSSFAQLTNSIEKTSKVGNEELASPTKISELNTTATNNSSDDRAAGDVIWGDNFNSSVNWLTSVSSGAADADHNWIIGTPTTWAFGAGINSTSGGNYAACKNGNPSGAPAQYAGGNFILAFDSVFNLSSYPRVLLEFQQKGARFNDDQKVEVSTNGGTTWTSVYSNENKPGLYYAAGDVYTNGEFIQVDITSAISGNPANVKIRFILNWPVSVTTPGVTYGWFVDDVAIREAYDNDLGLNDGFLSIGNWPADISMLPTSQATDLTFSGTVSNNGNLNLTGVVVNADITTASFSGTSATASIVSGNSDSLVVTTVFATPTVVGSHNVDFTLGATQILANTYNDDVTEVIEITAEVMAVDRYDDTEASITSAFYGWSGAVAGAISSIGNIMEVYTNGVIGGAQVGLYKPNSTGVGEGNILVILIAKWNTTSSIFETVYTYEDYIVQPGETGTMVELIFPTQLTVLAGDIYYVGAGFYDGQDVYIMMSGESPIGTVLGTDDVDFITLVESDPLMTNVGTPVVRAIFKDYSAIEASANTTFSIGQNVPNPFNNNSVITYSLTETENVTVEFVDVTGKVVKTVTPGTQVAGTYTINVDGSELAEGVYFYSFTIGDQKITKQIVVTK